MTNTITIPSNVAYAAERLATLDGIATATGWERAAIVWAFVEPVGRGTRTDRPTSTRPAKLTVNEFAALGIAGLRTHSTVDGYHQAWQTAIASGHAEPVEPGQHAALPDMPYPPGEATRVYVEHEGAIRAQAVADGMLTGSKAVNIAANTRSMAAAIKASPEVAEAARRALADRDRYERTVEDAEVDHVGRSVSRRLAQQLGLDLATSHLRQAAAEVASAAIERDTHGLTDHDAWNEALAVLRRLVDTIDANPADWSESDRAFLATLGVES